MCHASRLLLLTCHALCMNRAGQARPFTGAPAHVRDLHLGHRAPPVRAALLRPLLPQQQPRLLRVPPQGRWQEAGAAARGAPASGLLHVRGGGGDGGGVPGVHPALVRGVLPGQGRRSSVQVPQQDAGEWCGSAVRTSAAAFTWAVRFRRNTCGAAHHVFMCWRKYGTTANRPSQQHDCHPLHGLTSA